jgi:type V secretory pathway adhesin AidA
LAGKQNQATATFDNNTYMKKDGTFENDGNLTNFDKSGTDIQEDPLFADPENGDFHISGATQVARRTGDPRWLP